MESYLEKLLSQIRCKKARPYISDEIRSHIESQIEDNLSGGMEYEEAEKNAVADMGDPIEVGISLDKIHKPKIAWKLLVIVGVLSLLGILIQQSIFNKVVHYNLEPDGSITNGLSDIFIKAVHYDSKPCVMEIYQGTMTGYILSIILGFIIMCGIYFVDYTVLAKYSKIIGLFIMTMGILLLTGFFGGTINGVYYSVGFGMFRISATSLMMFYVPLYGAILYKYKGGGVLALLKACLWLIIPVIITFGMPNIGVAGIIMVSMLLQLTVAIMKGWFKIPVKGAVISLWTTFILLPVVVLFVMYIFRWLETYQMERIRAFLSTSGDGFYLTSVLRTLCKNVEMIGNSGNDVIGSLPNFNSDYVYAYILNSYGSIAGILVFAILGMLVMFVFGASIKQKNELGMVMGFGCGMILLLNIIINVLGAVGMLPPASSFLPFFSVGRSNILLCYALVGIMMSIYRYKDVYPKNIKSSQITIHKNFTINI